MTRTEDLLQDLQSALGRLRIVFEEYDLPCPQLLEFADREEAQRVLDALRFACHGSAWPPEATPDSVSVMGFRFRRPGLLPGGNMSIATARSMWEQVRRAAQSGDPAAMHEAASRFGPVAETMFQSWTDRAGIEAGRNSHEK